MLKMGKSKAEKEEFYGAKIFCGSNVPEDDVECESFTIVSIDSLLFMKTILPASIFRRLCLQNCRQTNDRLF